MLTTLRPRLLTSADPSWATHLSRHGSLPPWSAAPSNRLVLEVEAAGLRGRGGGWFPTARKMRAVMSSAQAGGGSPVVVGNGMESEPASGKDVTLMATSPHLVIDGLVAAAQAVWAEQAILCVPQGSPAVPVLAQALAERVSRGVDPLPVRLVNPPHRYLSGEESALVQWLNGGDVSPTMSKPFGSGVEGRPTLVQNVETLAHLGLIVRHGAAWFREAGTQQAPGTALISVSGAVNHSAVIEVPIGTPVSELIDRCGGASEPVQALLTGGYGGSWLRPENAGLPWTPEDLSAHRATVGAGILVALPATACGIAETARAVSYLAAQGAQQCGPCRFGMPALADELGELARPSHAASGTHGVERLIARISNRGACSLPNGGGRLAATALEVFQQELLAHQRGQCSGDRRTLPFPASRRAA